MRGAPPRLPVERMPTSRRDFLKAAAGLALAGAAVPAAAQDERTEEERPVFLLPGLDPAHDGLRVAQLSDLHVGPRTPVDLLRDAIDRANAFQPDLVVLTGDYLSRERSGVGLVREQLGGLRAPTVAVLGNHDHWVDPRGAARALAAHGYAVLRNQNTSLTLRGAPFTVVGIDDLMSGQARVADALRGARRDGSRLVLAHGPKTADQLQRAGERILCLSGHTHGGQIRIPLLTPLMLRTIAHEPYDRGLFRLGPVQLYVNRGVGSSVMRLRVNSPPEVTLATLRRAPDAA
jgi:predicted MPP superfamily phosphohydrolase